MAAPAGRIAAPSGPTKPVAPKGFQSVGTGRGNWVFQKLGPAPKAKAAPSQYASPLYNPSATLAGRNLSNAAWAIANQQVNGPIKDLAGQIATNNANSAQGQKTDFGYYQQLAAAAQQQVANAKASGATLQSQLVNSAGQTQSALAAAGQQAQGGAVGRMAALGLDGGASASLGAQTGAAQQQAALDSQTSQNLGAEQSANNVGYAAGVGANVSLAGTENIGNLARANALANIPISQKEADLRASRGTLAATALGQLRTQERNYQIAQGTLGFKNATLATTQAQNTARNNLTARGQNITAANDKATQLNRAAAISQSNVNNLRTTNTSAANNAANNSTRTLIAGMTANARAHKVATGPQANAIFAHVDYVTGEIQNLINHGFSPKDAYHVIQNGGRVQTGTNASGHATYRTYFPNKLGTQVLNAAYNVRSGAPGLTPGDLAWFASLGIKNPTRYAHSPGKASGPSNPLLAPPGTQTLTPTSNAL